MIVTWITSILTTFMHHYTKKFCFKDRNGRGIRLFGCVEMHVLKVLPNTLSAFSFFFRWRCFRRQRRRRKKNLLYCWNCIKSLKQYAWEAAAIFMTELCVCTHLWLQLFWLRGGIICHICLLFIASFKIRIIWILLLTYIYL